MDIEPFVAKFSLFVFLYAFLWTLEYAFPAEKNQPVQGRIQNVFFLAIYVTIGGLLVFALRDLLHIEHVVESASVFELSLLAFGSLLFGDFLFYWYHRAEHTFSWFWRVHELHHSDAHLNATSSLRTHWLESPLQFLALTTPTLIVFGDGPFTFVTSIVAFVALVLPHANLRWHLGAFSSVIIGPQLHRIHHSIEEKHQNKNFAQVFPFLDVLFGTYYAPAKNEFPKTGTTSMETDVPIWYATLKPLLPSRSRD